MSIRSLNIYKDDLHNCWQKVYSIKEVDPQTKQKKRETIDNIKVLLNQINLRFFKRPYK